MSKIYYVYILECSDHTYYCGYTTDLERRLCEHNQGVGSKYVRSRRPAKMVYYHSYSTRSDAMKEEYRIKHTLSRTDKIDLIYSSDNEIND